jgi:hypothetical protein
MIRGDLGCGESISNCVFHHRALAGIGITGITDIIRALVSFALPQTAYVPD